jgi:DNA-binding NtrC family response regulator
MWPWLRNVARILVVDDEPLISWSLSEALNDLGYDVEEAGDGRSAVDRMSTSPAFDVVLLDFRLPDSNDLRLFSRLRDIAPAARVILMTAFGTVDVLDRAVALGAFRVVHKPFEITDVASLVSEASSRGAA